MKPLRDAVLAIGLLTAWPVKATWPQEDDAPPDVAGWFPLVGIALGAIGAFVAAGFGIEAWRLDQAVTSALAVAVLAVFTRGLHWDGLADVADAWHIHDPRRRVEVMKDSATGAFGVLAISLTVVLQVVTLASVAAAGNHHVLLLAVVSGRLAATFSAWLGKPARPDGLGAAISRAPGLSGAIGFGIAVVVVAALAVGGYFGELGVVEVAAAVTGLSAALVVPHIVSGRFEGTSGDTMGASVVIVETMVLLSCAMVVGL